MTRVNWLAAACMALGALSSCAKTGPVPPAPPPIPAGTVRPGTPPVREEVGEPEVSVGLAWDLDSLIVDPVGRAEVHAPELQTLEARGRLQIQLDGGRVSVQALDAEPWKASLAPRDTLRIAGVDGPVSGPARLIRWKGSSWRGEFRVFVNPRGRLTAATRMPLETYLKGVVPGEIGALEESLIEAGRAQAIAARSYTLFYRGRRAAEGFDLYGTVEDQVYGPTESERPLATRCVESTAGRVALSSGVPIRANYHSTCGGIMSDVWEAWPAAPLPYLVSHRDRDDGADYCAVSPHHRWREEWSPSELAANLARFAPVQGIVVPSAGVGEIVDVRIASRSRSGRVWRLWIRTTTGEIVIPAYSIRQMLRRGGNSSAILRSNLFKIEVRRNPRSRAATAIVATGAGSGHGVGLCQTGALGMARLGQTGEKILSHYYPGAELVRRY